jgi:hypothetical protein
LSRQICSKPKKSGKQRQPVGIGFRPTTDGVQMKKLGVALAMTIAAVGAARAADLPTKKEAPPPPVNCFASVWTWLDSTAADCPLSYGPFTVYATVDLGYGYNTNGANYTQSGTTASTVSSPSRATVSNGCRRRTASASRLPASR